MRSLLHAQVLIDGHTGRGCDQASGTTQLRLLQPARRGVPADGDSAQSVQHRTDVGEVLVCEVMVDEVFLHDDAEQRGQAPGIGAGAYLQVDVGQVGGLGAHRVDHDHGASGILGDVLQYGASSGHPMGLVGVLAEEHRDLGVLEVPVGVAPGEVGIDPGLAALLLGERIGPVPGTQRCRERLTVDPTQVIALTTAAVQQDGLTVSVSDRPQSGSDLVDRGVPIQCGEPAVRLTSQRRGEPVATVLVVIQPQRFVAGVATTGRVLLIAADPDEPALGHLDPQTAVVLTEDAGAAVPRTVLVGHRTS